MASTAGDGLQWLKVVGLECVEKARKARRRERLRRLSATIIEACIDGERRHRAVQSDQRGKSDSAGARRYLAAAVVRRPSHDMGEGAESTASESVEWLRVAGGAATSRPRATGSQKGILELGGVMSSRW
ncbi:hypothetical protein DFH09DRAFT_1090920 [Mycena vulgaris]|nr:hypothetical protein DFH09DRAFT_1090920 [Mycena vulgaris]